MLWISAFPRLYTPITALAANESSSTSSSSANKSSQVASNESVQKIKQKGTLVVGMSADYPPYEFTTKENGKTKYVGFEVSLAKQFDKDLGVKLVIKNMDFDSLLVALETGKIDAIISGMNVTAERKKSVDFSNTCYSGVRYLLINQADKDTLVKVHKL
ncbi:ABC transporter permease, partial [Limosilactobacillus reuteri]|uniref:transporter substrate-binding domain-containing protein n=1 Tax=Limosilactobacillus reuteri TaxID=1598 RepID=UPI000BC6C6D9